MWKSTLSLPGAWEELLSPEADLSWLARSSPNTIFSWVEACLDERISRYLLFSELQSFPNKADYNTSWGWRGYELVLGRGGGSQGHFTACVFLGVTPISRHLQFCLSPFLPPSLSLLSSAWTFITFSNETHYLTLVRLKQLFLLDGTIYPPSHPSAILPVSD